MTLVSEYPTAEMLTSAFQIDSTETDRRWHDIVAELDRRGFLAGSLGLAAFLAGCGGGDTAQQPTVRTVRAETPFGSFDIPLAPQRVVILEGRQDLETAIVLGMPRPVAIGDNAVDTEGAAAPFLGFDSAGIELIPGGEVDLEKVLALEPDLIIGRASNIEPLAADLATIAPLLPVEIDELAWRPELETVGRWTRRSDQVSAALRAHDDLMEQFRDTHAARLDTATAAVIQPWSGGTWYSSPSDGFLLQARTLRELGGTFVEAIERAPLPEPGGMSEFSAERLDLLAEADILLVASFSAAERSELAANPLWAQLPAVRADRVVHTDIRTNRGSVLAADECVRLWDRAYSLLD